MAPRVALVTVGCAKNSADSDVLAARLGAAGLRVSDDPNEADAVIVNTCGFIRSACEESLDEIMELAALKTQGTCRRLVVCGCLPTRYGDALRRELPEADAIFGLVDDDADEIAAYIRRELRREPSPVPGGAAHAEPLPEGWARAAPTVPYAYVKISDGCSRACSFCTIPAIRGPYRSRAAEDIEAEVDFLANTGMGEIVLVGQETTNWGVDLPGAPSIADLLVSLAARHPIWYRMMYMQPDGVTDELVDVIASHANICDYFDIPFQHASRPILSAMRRPGEGSAFLDLLARVRARIPDATLRTSLIVGFPGETEDDFHSLVDFVEAASFDYAGLFLYSAEDGTPAAAFPGQVPRDVSTERHRQIAELAERIWSDKARRLIGGEWDVLVDGPADEQEYSAEGRSQCQAPETDGVCLLRDVQAPAGRLVRVRMIGVDGYDMICEPA